MRRDYFDFKQFSVANKLSAMPVSTDSVLIGAWCNVDDAFRALDVGTGTGVITLMLAQRNPNLTVDAIDIDKNSTLEASDNFANSPWGNRLNISLADFNDWQGKYDLVVSNPPFFIDGIHSPNVARASARHAQSLTYKQLIFHGFDLLNDNGRLSFITPFDQRHLIIDIATFGSFCISRECVVISMTGKSPKRIMWELALETSVLKREQIILFNADGTPTTSYRNICSDFYLNF